MARKPQNEGGGTFTEAVEANRQRAAGEYDNRRARVQRLNEETQRVMDESRPTPTQEENDRIKLGLLTSDDEKEPDGSPEQGDGFVQRSGIDAPDAPDDVRRAGYYRNRESSSE